MKIESPKNVILYARVSSQKQSQYWESIDNQILEMKRFCSKNAWNIIEVFKEQFTGTKESRPELNRAIETITILKKQGIKIDYFIFHKIDRNSRSESVYFQIKEKLKVLWVQMRDVLGIIQDEKNVVNIEGVDTNGYDWAVSSPSESAEIFTALSAGQERKTILQRTIPQEIRDSYAGYWQKSPIFGFKNKKIINEEGKRKNIQVPCEIESIWIIQMFKLYDAWLKDEEIVDEINAMGYLSRIQHKWDINKTEAVGTKWWNKLTIKQLQKYISKPIYAGVAIVEWRGNDPRVVLQKYSGLVDVDLWNRVNKGKRKIIIETNGVVKILGWKDLIENPEIKRRFRDNPSFPFGNLVFAPESLRFLNGNTTKGRTGGRYSYYSGKVGKKTVSYGKEVFEKNIIDYLASIEMDSWWMKVYMVMLAKIWDERKDGARTNKQIKEQNLLALQERSRRILWEVSGLINFPALLEWKNKELESIQEEIQMVKQDIDESVNEINLEWLQKYGETLIENLWRIALNTREHETLKLLFRFVFTQTPHYDEIVNRNTSLRSLFALVKQTKSPSEEELVEILIGSLTQNRTELAGFGVLNSDRWTMRL